jgi:YD repeat-containing protein
MALTVEDAITAIVTQADALAGTSTAEDLVYLAKSLQAVSDTRQASDAAVQAVVDRANALSAGATSEDLIYLAKAVEALSVGSAMADITAEGNTQVSNVVASGDQQAARVAASIFEAELRSTDITYDEFGRITAIAETLSDGKTRNTVFEYNSADQIASATKTFGGETWEEVFAYDDAGNVTSTTTTRVF